MRRLLVPLAVVALIAAPARAQDTTDVRRVQDTAMVTGSGPTPFVITPYIGAQLADNASAMRRTTPVVMLDATYRFTPHLGVGISLGASRPETDGSYFPLVRMQAGDTNYYYQVSQRTTLYTYGVHATASFPVGRWVPYAQAGVGRYTFTMDPQAVGSTLRYSGPQFALGGGINIPLGTRTGVTLDLRDVILTSYDREKLSASDPLFVDPNFDQTRAGLPAARSTAHTLRLTVGVSFVPDSKGGAQ